MRAWFTKNLKSIIPIAVAVLFLILPHTAFALEWPGWLNPFNGIKNSFVEGFMFLLDLALQAFALLLAFAAFILELVIDLTIVKMRWWIDGGEGGFQGIQAINLAWRAIRDVANILFVFVLLLVSINIILGSWGSGPYNKSLIPKIIIAALLINFSLMFTKVVIDVSNLTAYEFYKAAANIKGEGGTKLFGVIPTTGLTMSIMNGLRMNQIVNDDGKLQDTVNNKSYVLFSTVLGIVVVLTAAFVLMVMAVMLLVRFVLFLILMVTSPIAFIGELLPQLSTHSKKWWKTLADQATFAPVFFVFILVVVLIINDPGFSEMLRQNYAATGGGVGVYFANLVPIVFQYAIVIGLLVAALVASKQTANMSGNAVAKWTGKAAFGGAAAVGRNTFGRLGNRMANSSWLGEQAKRGGASGSLAKGLLLSGDKLRTSTFHAGGIMDVGSDGIFGGAGNKGGLVGARKARAEAIEKRGKIYAPAMAMGEQNKIIKDAKKKRDEAIARGDWDTHMKEQEKISAAQQTLKEIRGEKTEAHKKLAEETQKLTDAQRREAETVMQVIDAQEEYIEKLKRDAAMETDEKKKRNLLRQADIAKEDLGKYKTEKGDLMNYIQAQKDLSKVVKSASGQVFASQRAYGESLATNSAFRSTREAGEALRKGKDKTSDELASEVIKAMKKETESRLKSEKKEVEVEVVFENKQGQRVDRGGNTLPPKEPPKIIV